MYLCARPITSPNAIEKPANIAVSVPKARVIAKIIVKIEKDSNAIKALVLDLMKRFFRELPIQALRFPSSIRLRSYDVMPIQQFQECAQSSYFPRMICEARKTYAVAKISPS